MDDWLWGREGWGTGEGPPGWGLAHPPPPPSRGPPTPPPPHSPPPPPTQRVPTPGGPPPELVSGSVRRASEVQKRGLQEERRPCAQIVVERGGGVAKRNREMFVRAIKTRPKCPPKGTLRIKREQGESPNEIKIKGFLDEEDGVRRR